MVIVFSDTTLFHINKETARFSGLWWYCGSSKVDCGILDGFIKIESQFTAE